MPELTVEANPIIACERTFIALRDNAFVAMNDTARAGIELGKALLALREETGSDKVFAARLIELGSALPVHETRNLMKLAARAITEGNALFEDKQRMMWAQDQLGLLPPSSSHTSEGVAIVTPRHAIGAVATALAKLSQAIGVSPFEQWSQAERQLVRELRDRLDALSGLR